MTIHYPLYIRRPKRIDITKDEFYHLSYHGLSCVWCSWKALFHFDENGDLKMFTPENGAGLSDNYRFKDMNWRYNPECEMFNCIIPKESKLFKTILKYCDKLIMK